METVFMNKAVTIPPEDMRKMQVMQLDMLKELDRVCRANDIHYTICNGSLLGAVRHKGYIPWDDDADTMMLREDYEKFKQCANQLNPDICYFQDHSTESEYRWGYGKLRRTGTTYIRAGQEHLKGKTGVFIDIFPMDDIKNSSFGSAVQRILAYCSRKITYAEVAKKQYVGLKGWGFWFLSLIPLSIVFAIMNLYAKKSNNSTPNRVTTLFMPISKHKDPYTGEMLYGRPKKWLLETKEYDFEGLKLMGPVDYDECLRWQYGTNYMTPPPENERGQHAPVSSYSLG